MSMEIHVFSNRQLGSIEAWQEAIAAAGFDVLLSAARPFEALQGFLPVQAGGKATGFECYHDDAGQLIAAYADVAFGHPWKHALSFRWGGDLAECLAAYMAAVAYAQATDGVVLDAEEGEVLSPQKVMDTVREMERYLPVIEAERARSQDQSNEPES